MFTDTVLLEDMPSRHAQIRHFGKFRSKSYFFIFTLFFCFFSKLLYCLSHFSSDVKCSCFFLQCSRFVNLFGHLLIFGLPQRFPVEKSKTNANITNKSLNKKCWEGLCGSHRFEVLVSGSGVSCCQSHQGRESPRGGGGCS